MVRNIQLKHSGKYVCMVHTEVDTVSAAADIIVRGMPLPPVYFDYFETLCGGWVVEAYDTRMYLNQTKLNQIKKTKIWPQTLSANFSRPATCSLF